MTYAQLYEIADNVRASVGMLPWQISLGTQGDSYYVQLKYMDVDVATGKPEVQSCRKWLVSQHATESEAVQTILKAAITSAEHQVREKFTYKGQAVFSPHFDVNWMAEAVATREIPHDARKPQ